MDPTDFECSICLGKNRLNITSSWDYFLHLQNRVKDSQVLILFFFISETFQPPIRMTNCGHSFCEHCILPRHFNIGWLCPICKHMQNKSAVALARNFSLEQIVVSFRSQQGSSQIGEFGRCKQESHQQDITLCESTSKLLK